MKSIVIAHQTVIDGDAIGNDILGMYSCLKHEGCDVSIFADNYLGTFNSLKSQRIKSLKAAREPDTLVIYHHSIFWEGGREFLLKCRGKIIFKYHNVTPPEYFREYSSSLYEKCVKGIDQTKEFIQLFDGCLWAACSAFSGDDLARKGIDKQFLTIIPPFNALPLLDTIEPDYAIIQKLINNRKNNVLFVGRIAPNKGHINLIQSIKEYQEYYNDGVHLWIIGPFDESLKHYNLKLEKMVKDNDLENTITFTGKIPLNLIKSYYLACDEFLCMSDHEGFCVPIIEAQKMMLPVITTGSSALRETAGKNQIVMDESDSPFAASAIYTVYSEPFVRKFCQDHGLINVTSRFSNSIIRNQFLHAVKRGAGREQV
jgi:glycosyltransferase involved in cell wall biosynthesis